LYKENRPPTAWPHCLTSISFGCNHIHRLPSPSIDDPTTNKQPAEISHVHHSALHQLFAVSPSTQLSLSSDLGLLGQTHLRRITNQPTAMCFRAEPRTKYYYREEIIPARHHHGHHHHHHGHHHHHHPSPTRVSYTSVTRRSYHSPRISSSSHKAY
jgi:hypothetical protein